jgi:hypothetical protein
MQDHVALKGLQEQMDYANYKNYQQKFGAQAKDVIAMKESLHKAAKNNA